MDAVLQHLLQGVVVSADGCGVQHLDEVGHLAFGQVVGDGVVPGVRHTLPVDAEHAGGQSVQLAWARLDVILCVVLSRTTCTCLNQVINILTNRSHSQIICMVYSFTLMLMSACEGSCRMCPFTTMSSNNAPSESRPLAMWVILRISPTKIRSHHMSPPTIAKALAVLHLGA